MINYLEEFTSKQIDFASQHDVLNTLPIIKRYGIYDIDLLNDLESVMRKRGYGSTYEKLVENFKRLNANCSNLDKKLINFLKKVELFDAVIYNDYIDLLSHRNGITVDDFFDKNYIARHDTMVEENKKSLRGYLLNRLAKNAMFFLILCLYPESVRHDVERSRH